LGRSTRSFIAAIVVKNCNSQDVRFDEWLTLVFCAVFFFFSWKLALICSCPPVNSSYFTSPWTIWSHFGKIITVCYPHGGKMITAYIPPAKWTPPTKPSRPSKSTRIHQPLDLFSLKDYELFWKLYKEQKKKKKRLSIFIFYKAGVIPEGAVSWRGYWTWVGSVSHHSPWVKYEMMIFYSSGNLAQAFLFKEFKRACGQSCLVVACFACPAAEYSLYNIFFCFSKRDFNSRISEDTSHV
jgi:hypothetical protein